MPDPIKDVLKSINAQQSKFLASGSVEFLEELQEEVAAKLDAARETARDEEDEDA